MTARAVQHDLPDQEAPAYDVVGIGVSVWDTILRISRLPHPGEVIRASDRIQSLGGGVTVAVATAAQLGSSVAMIDALGDDTASSAILQTLTQSGVDCRGIQRCPGETGSLATIWTSESDAERTIVYSPGSACDGLQLNSKIESMIRRAKIIHCNGRHPEICDAAIEAAKDNATKISFDGGAYRFRKEILPMLRTADIVIVARHFAGEFFLDCNGQENSEAIASMKTSELARFIHCELGCEVVGVTDGPRGSDLVDSEGRSVHQSALGVESAIDTTGCGDTYHGAFLDAYCRGLGIQECALRAAEVAGETAARMGGFRLG